MYNIEAVTDITLQVHDTKNETTATYTGSSTTSDRYSLYRFKAGEAGSELAESFRESMKTIKDELMSGSTKYIQNEPVNNISRQEPPMPQSFDEDHYGFSLHVFGFNPIYTTNYPASSQSISNQGIVTFSGLNAESAPALLGGAGLKFSPAKRFFVSINVFSPYSQKGKLTEQLTMPYGSIATTMDPLVTHDISYGLDMDYLVHATSRSRWYVGAGYIRSAFSLKIQESSSITVFGSGYDKYAGMSIDRYQFIKSVDLFRINAGYEWVMTNNLSLSLFAYYPFSRNVKFSADGSASSNDFGPTSYDTVSNTLVELRNPILVNMILSMYF